MVATDNELILKHIESLGYNGMMTSSSCLTGTDRIAEVASRTNFDYYIKCSGG